MMNVIDVRGGRVHYFAVTILTLSLFATTGCEALSDPESAESTTAYLEASGSSQVVTWNCTGSPCPWGPTTSNPALVWPASESPLNTRLGYTVTAGVYLPAAAANGMTITITSGSAGAYAGLPAGGSHRVLGTITPGSPLTVSGLIVGEVLSVQSGGNFSYSVSGGGAPPPPPPPPPPGGTSSQVVTWNCTGSPCPWGASAANPAAVWPASANPTSIRHGYTASHPVYLPSAVANGVTITVQSGSAKAYAGLPLGPSHRVLATLAAGQSVVVSGVGTSEVLSLQGGAAFTYTLAGLGGGGDPPPDPNAIHSIPAYWRCNLEGCTEPDWIGSVITWPSWAAYSTNNREGEKSRTVYSSATGEMLFPYMGPWADGCQVTAQSGIVLIIEWQRGTNTWRETLLSPGQSHTIDLVSPENNAMIETEDGDTQGFSVTLNNCNPQPL
jgi:hypothetical protein